MIKPAMQRGDAFNEEDLNKQQIVDAINFIKGEGGIRVHCRPRNFKIEQ